jgi:hypothetical protein
LRQSRTSVDRYWTPRFKTELEPRQRQVADALPAETFRFSTRFAAIDVLYLMALAAFD